jgi:hypothetical protein
MLRRSEFTRGVTQVRFKMIPRVIIMEKEAKRDAKRNMEGEIQPEKREIQPKRGREGWESDSRPEPQR